MSDPLGLSIGTANLVAARVGSAPVTRRSVLTVFGHRPPEVGIPEENPNLTEPGLVLRGFVEQIGVPTPLIAPDGSSHSGEALAVEALDAMARTVGYGAPVAIAVPAHWNPAVVAALREALGTKQSLTPGGIPPTLISDATAALAALYAKPGVPTDGIVALCDFGASGTSVTLTDAAANFQHIGQTLRYPDFSGDQIDQAILSHIQAGAAANSDAAGTAPVNGVARRLDECRRAKEQLSDATVAVIPAEMPGAPDDIRFFRTELERLIAEPLGRLVGNVEDVLRRNRIPPAKLAAIATVGGGACIPLVTQQLEQRLQAPVVTTPHPALSAAIGAAVLAEQKSSTDAPTGAQATALAPGAAAAAPTRIDAPAPTDVAPAAWAAGAAAAAAGESVEDGAQSATYRALAWSQEASTGDEPLPYTGEDHSGEYGRSTTAAPPPAAPEPARTDYAVAPEPSRRYKRSGVVFSMAATAALVALLLAGLVVFKLSSTDHGPTQKPTPTPSTLPSVGSLPPEPPPATATETPSNPSPTESAIPPPPPQTTEPPITTTTTTTTTTVPTTTTTVPTTTSTRPSTTYPTTRPTTTYPIYPPVIPPSTTAQLPPLVPVRPTYGH